ncbi:DUF6596 domain-containing protein [Streptosporangium sp. NPDC023615]|uniref:RNA polymerase sigma factor n=1 Tax=Streptosporangium sp. NPDC023615 TaxID=3154794 RepID=UPI003418A6C7
MLAATVRVTRDIDAAEEAVQDACVQALRTWPRDGVPGNPGAWLTTVARRNALNTIRRRRTLETKLPLLLGPDDTGAPSGADLVRDELTGRALDLARTLRLLLPADREVAGLLALLLAQHARRAGRTDARGRLLRLAEQDRSAWDRDMIAEADRLVVGALTAGPPGRFTLQAAIAALHAQAPGYAETDWPHILTLYDELLRIWPSPVVALNRAVATSMVHGPEAALAEVEALERQGRLAGYLYLHATKADLLHRLGRDAAAVRAYRAALALSDNAAEQEFLTGRIGPAGDGTAQSGANAGGSSR